MNGTNADDFRRSFMIRRNEREEEREIERKREREIEREGEIGTPHATQA